MLKSKSTKVTPSVMGIKIKAFSADVTNKSAREFVNRNAMAANALSQTDLDIINNIDMLLQDLRNVTDVE